MKTAIKEKDIVKTLMNNGSFNILLKTFRATGLIDILRNANSVYTLFAPNEKAFKKLSPSGMLKRLLKDRDLLTRVIAYHIIPARVDLKHVDGRKTVKTLEGKSLLIDTTSGLRVNNSAILRAGIECGNGLIHEIDSVLLP
ncbi:MAG: fasciclin domain-containing protein [Candidatus Firestonebacteria bacterium]